MKDQNCPYRMRTQNLLPKFESSEEPVRVHDEMTEAARAKALGNCAGKCNDASTR